ncbi:aminodeoxychorismate synthase component I [Chloroflexota bacterium]
MEKSASNIKLYPLVEELCTSLSASQAFEVFRDRPFSIFLDSGMDYQKLGRYSFIGIDPFLILKSRGQEINLIGPQGERIIQGNPFDMLGELLQKYRLDDSSYPLPFVGGAVGYLSYDLCHFIEKLPTNAYDDLGIPESYFAFYDAVVAFDHLEDKSYIVSTGFPEKGDGRHARAEARLRYLKEILADLPFRGEAETELYAEPFPREVELHSNFTHEGYLTAVEAVREHIRAGDIFQANLSQRFEADLSIPPYELYRRLRRINPAPFACYLNFDGVTVVSASPERFLKVRGDLVETRPIKGTRRRGKDQIEDEAFASELVHSIKDQAEHVMIVDLERNDLGRVCRYGTVTVSELAALEKYATVFHLTSTVEGQLSSGKDIVDLLKASFPGGSITGAPKVRAMEIIDELEPTRRSVYTGSIGYLSFDGNLDLNIAIRTMLVKEGKVYFQVGGAVVYDSDPEAEYIETLDKGKAMIEALTVTPESVMEAKK